MALDVELTTLLVNNFARIIILFPLVGESINIEGDVYFVAEHAEGEKLLYGVLENMTHRARPIKNKYQSMVLTFRQIGDLLEKVLIVLIGM